MSEEKETKEEAAQEFRIDPESELRFEVEGKEKVTIELKSGLAEIFGVELVKNKKFTFGPGAKVAVFTWHGCTLEISLLSVLFSFHRNKSVYFWGLSYAFIAV
ncbi:hypothetical protein V5799_031063 [Amblyomma americanum]|uniref:Clp1 N-terminal domain-containing protein n=1 Tax=Amblyomma americanum TaxID=6943 RepID=A0AAQ4ELD4_AMBAM